DPHRRAASRRLDHPAGGPHSPGDRRNLLAMPLAAWRAARAGRAPGRGGGRVRVRGDGGSGGGELTGRRALSPPPRLVQAARLLGDLAAALLAFWLAFQLRTHLALPLTSTLLPADRLRYFTSHWPVLLAGQATVLYFFGFYDTGPPAPRSDTLRRLLIACGLQGAALVAFYFFTDRSFPRSVLLLYVALDVLALFYWRTTLDRGLEEPERMVVLVGCGPAAQEIAASIAERRWHGLRVAGFVPAPGEQALSGASTALGVHLGRLDDG